MAMLKVLIASSRHHEDMLELDHSFKSHYAYRMRANVESQNASFNFEPIKLPREVHLSYMRDKSSLLKTWDDASLIYVGMLDDVLVSYVVIDAKTLPMTARVTNLVVMPEVRQNGIGRTMLAAVEDWGARQGLLRVLLEIPMRNYPMVELGLRCGYEICGFMEQYFPNDDPALFYQKRLA